MSRWYGGEVAKNVTIAGTDRLRDWDSDKREGGGPKMWEICVTSFLGGP